MGSVQSGDNSTMRAQRPHGKTVDGMASLAVVSRRAYVNHPLPTVGVTMTSPRPLAALLAPAALSHGALAQSSEAIRFARNAGVANDGRIAFTYQDDIWVVDADGANPRRLTVNVARDFSPRFSPDGKWIAFTSNRTGNNDVFVMPSTGGEPRQLTW